MKIQEASKAVVEGKLLEGYTPILPLKDVVLLPNIIVPINIGRIKSLNAIEATGMTADD